MLRHYAHLSLTLMVPDHMELDTETRSKSLVAFSVRTCCKQGWYSLCNIVRKHCGQFGAAVMLCE